MSMFIQLLSCKRPSIDDVTVTVTTGLWPKDVMEYGKNYTELVSWTPEKCPRDPITFWEW